MIKGVNHQVVEVTRPGCEYFERVLFFVKPEYSSLSDRKIYERADTIARNTGTPPRARKRRKRVYSVFSPFIWAAMGAAVCALVMKSFAL